MEEQIAESVLLDVFDQIKGDFGKNRPFINIDDFKRSVIRNEPQSFREFLEKRLQGGKGLTEFNSTIEDLFRNMCESVSPAVDPNTAAPEN